MPADQNRKETSAVVRTVSVESLSARRGANGRPSRTASARLSLSLTMEPVGHTNIVLRVIVRLVREMSGFTARPAPTRREAGGGARVGHTGLPATSGGGDAAQESV